MSTSTKKSDDNIPPKYPYAWSPNSTVTLDEFITKWKPSMVQNDGTKPWLWVRNEDTSSQTSVEDEASALVKAATLLQEVTEKVEQIKNDDSIPVRSNKKTGVKSKKEVREQVQAEAIEKLKEISKEHGYVCGKWLIFAPSDRVDLIWAGISSSLVSGPLSFTSAFCAKVSTSPQNEVPGYQHVICVYIPDVYDKESVTEVMRVLLRKHGANLTGVKSDLYTVIGLDSKHPSGISSTVWKNTTLLKDAEMKELKDAYFAELTASKAAASTQAGATKKSKQVGGKPRFLKKNVKDDDPFASDDEGGAKQLSSDRSGGGTTAIKRTHDSEREGDEGKAQSKVKRKKATH
ncbi:hypothetical protein PAXRUDRAFT_831416 [Paxillus rubicundulus Ve08.2h10]|uniref:Uncharacterized protein n=1 Tax=Paxillus rubicundulus Ve08.2h10 TaxID=930991 RepID=A0A0D0DS16_9AGAM|nr:hypothetical protein PAXRUDRAFT_831416 [Paxillus rubicundulus Ve08.2h10]